ncbi:uroporphyrinogen-III C-methyltransferase [Paenibacillus thermotolerans]|uniref:uroporphyrinogen-III C-methyltransferase n=1 Tax=Paenibacillus thermotolerans TaxID=3027807 RepID=UPI00236825A3|nr:MULTISPECIES: uroporphyrinogen-III C-methyltransferase [unclassified Paenibacillus]
MNDGERKGKVYLVGAGPGDPKLITVRGLEAVKKADVIVYDRLASPKLLLHMKPGAEKVFVGKLPDKHMMKQEDINRLLVRLAEEGKTVARLKGGDPSVFGRVGEEAETLAAAGIEFEIIPGITSSIAVPAYAGIPVTHRDFTSSFSIVTGHEYPNKTYNRVDWDHLAKASGTLIFLMGVANIGNITAELISGGMKQSTPVALIRWGTWMEQETLTGSLSDIADKVKSSGFSSPAVIIVGDVVKLRDKISWFEKRPLFGRRILVTRARAQASELVDKIDELGGDAVECPVIRTQAVGGPEAAAALDRALEQIDQYDRVLFTSVNGVEFFFQACLERGIDIRRLHKAKIGAVGPKTDEALRLRGLIGEPLPEIFQGDVWAASLAHELAPGEKVLLPRGNLAKEDVPSILRAAGADVTEAVCYETLPSDDGVEEALELLREGRIHAVTFTSSSTVRNLLEALEKHGGGNPAVLLENVPVFCIGPVTEKTARQMGLRVTAVAREASIASLIEELIRHLSREE